MIKDLLAPDLDEPAIGYLMNTVKDDGSWPDIDYVDVSRTGFQHGWHLENMYLLSKAYKKRIHESRGEKYRSVCP